MRMSRIFQPTLRNVPAAAETAGHRLMLRAGLVRRAAAGVYTWLPAGVRVLHKIAGVVREEMARAGAQEVLMPALQPAELWRESGRWADYGQELFRLQDRHGRWFALGPTHEEIVTDLVRGEVRSGRRLPLCLFQIHTKYRDEARPRFGVARGREFMMKDAYSFDRDQAGLDRTYAAMAEAYGRVFRRIGLDARPVMADPGAIGGDTTHEFLAPSAAGETKVLSCRACDYAATVERAAASAGGGRGRAEAGTAGDGAAAVAPGGVGPATAAPADPTAVATPGMHTVAAVAGFLGVGTERIIKTMVVVTPDGRVAAGLVRGDHGLSRPKLARALGVAGVELAGPEVVERVTDAPVGFAGPVGLDGPRLVADPAVMAIADAVAGANQADTHLVGVLPGRDFRPALVADIREVAAGEPCPACGAALLGWTGIEVGHIFKLGTKYSEPFGAEYAGPDGRRPLVMGCYGIGVSRAAAAVVEKHHDPDGIVWPAAIAPWHVLVLPVNDRDEAVRAMAEEVYGGLVAVGVEAVLDDRPERAGVKFKDADLCGLPWRVTVGARALAEGAVEVRTRAAGEVRRVPLGRVVEQLAAEVRRRLAAGRAGA